MACLSVRLSDNGADIQRLQLPYIITAIDLLNHSKESNTIPKFANFVAMNTVANILQTRLIVFVLGLEVLTFTVAEDKAKHNIPLRLDDKK